MRIEFQAKMLRAEAHGSSGFTLWEQEQARQQCAAADADGADHSLFFGLQRLRHKWQIKEKICGRERERDQVAIATSLEFVGWKIDLAARQLYDPDGAEVAMTSVEFDLLAAFCRNLRRVLSREQLLKLSHSGLAGPTTRSIDVHVSRIRPKIEPNPHHPIYIKTVRLGGYIFTPPVRALRSDRRTA